MGGEGGLEFGQERGGGADGARGGFFRATEDRERADGFADVPLDGVQAIAAVGEVRRTDIFAGGQEVFHAPRQEGAERDLERARREIDVVVAAATRVEIDRVAADAHAVRESFGGDFGVRRRGRFPTCVGADVEFGNRELGLNAAALADVGIFRETVFGADDIGAEAEALPTRAAVGARSFGLQPVEQRETELFARSEVARGFGRGHLKQIAQHVVVLRPVHERGVASVGAGNEIRAINDAAIFKEAGALRGIEAHGEGFESARRGIIVTEKFAGPSRREGRNVVAPQRVVARTVDGVIFAGDVIHGEAARERLHVVRARLGDGVRLAGDALRLGTGDVLGARERQQFARLTRIDEQRCAEDELAAGLGAADEDRVDAVAGGRGG